MMLKRWGLSSPQQAVSFSVPSSSGNKAPVLGSEIRTLGNWEGCHIRDGDI